MSDTIYTNHPMASPTHYCKDCGALWRQNDDFTMSLRWANACESCNNTPVGGQLFPLTEIPLPTLPPVSVRPDVMDCTVMLHEKDAEIERLRQSMRAYRILRVSIEAMMAPLGYHGSIAARDDRVQAVMDALAQIDAIENEGNPIRWSAILESLRDKDKGGPA